MGCSSIVYLGVIFVLSSFHRKLSKKAEEKKVMFFFFWLYNLREGNRNLRCLYHDNIILVVLLLLDLI